MAPAGRQKTFELVPNAPVLGQQRPGDDAQPIYSKPPMTTKQAKKLHNQKNKGPKLSKAEQRRIELMEQDRIRKEFEKEKAQARARTAREKKKAREDKEKEERKRKGLPLVDIHPSQDTISRFISRVGRVIGVKRDSAAANTLDAVREDSETATDGGESVTDAGDEEHVESDKENEEPDKNPIPERQAKRPRLSQADEKLASRASPVSFQRRAGPVAKLAQDRNTESYSRASSVDVDDPINQTLLEDQFIADLALATSRSVADRNTNAGRLTVALVEHHPAAMPQPVAPTVPVSAVPREPSEPRPLPQRLQTPQQFTAHVKEGLSQPNSRAASHVPSHMGNTAFKKPVPPYIPAPRPRPALKPPVFQVPNIHPKFKTPALGPNLTATRPKFLPRHLNTAQKRRIAVDPRSLASVTMTTHAVPTSTQAFLLDHMDDLFPSPTQEARELSGDFMSEPPKPKADPPRQSINRPMRLSEAAVNPNSVIAPSTGAVSRPPATIPPVPAAEESFESFCISTQDILISTQDILEIDTPSKVRPTSARPLLPAVNQEILPVALPIKEIGTSPANLIAVPGTFPAYIQQPQHSVNGAEVSAKSNDAVACCPCESLSADPQFHEHGSSCPAIRSNLSSPRVAQPEKGGQPAASSRPLRSSYQRHATVVQQRSTPKSSSNHNLTVETPKPVTTPNKRPPKKRMFGSSGPGAEGLVAMERSHREAQRVTRAREAEARAQQKLRNRPTHAPEQVKLDIAELTDDILDDDFGGESTKKGSSRRPSDAVQQGSDVQSLPCEDRATTLAASQETDYGDIDGDEFDFLKGDISWLDEDLDDI